MRLRGFVQARHSSHHGLVMGAKVTRTDFEWSADDQPHPCRRKEILEKHPEIKSLMVVDHSFKYQVAALVVFQLVMAYVVHDLHFGWLLLLTYVVSGTINHALLLAIHEVAHSQAFGHARPTANKLFGLFANLPIGMPCTITFQKYHLEHHRYQGVDVIDTDIPTKLEAKFFYNTFTKILWVFLQPLFYSLRPMVTRPHALSSLECTNVAIELLLDAAMLYFGSWRSIFYLIAGTLLGMGLHPVAGHFISEHYMFLRGQETYSYYGPLNAVTFNVGYHNEHHDFPNVPGSLLPRVTEIAAEYYKAMPSHSSWVKVIYDYITDPSIGPYSRVKRKDPEKSQ